jgi:hypothetical protein
MGFLGHALQKITVTMSYSYWRGRRGILCGAMAFD